MAIPAILGVAARATGTGLATGARYAGRAAWSGIKSGVVHGTRGAIAAQRNPMLSRGLAAVETLASRVSEKAQTKSNDKVAPARTSNQEKAEADERANQERQARVHEALVGGASEETVGVLKVISHDTKDILAGIELLVEDGIGFKEPKKGTGVFGSLLAMLGGLTIFSKGFLPQLGGFLTKMAGRMGATIAGLVSRALGSVVSTVMRLTGSVASTAATVGRAALRGGAALAGTAAAAGRVVGKAGPAVANAAGSTGRMVAKAGTKTALKKIPIIGAGVGLALGAGRAMAGDWTGAGMEVASGALGTIPGLGTAASLGVDAAILSRDMKRRRQAQSTQDATTPLVEPLVAPEPESSDWTYTDPSEMRQTTKVESTLSTISYTLGTMLEYMVAPHRGIYTQPVDRSNLFDWSSFFRSAPEPGVNSSPGSTPTSGNSSLSASGDDAALLDLIASGEAGREGYDSVWSGSRLKPSKPLTEMTFGEVKAWQRDTLNEQKSRGIPASRRSSAAGRYQFISSTLKAQQSAAGLSDDDLFTPENQDKLALALLNADRNRGLSAWREGRASDSDFINYVSSQWAAFKNTTGRGTYDVKGFNHASIGGGDLLNAANRRNNLPRAAAPAEPVSVQVRDSVTQHNAKWHAPMLLPQPVPVPVAGASRGSSSAPSSVVPMITHSPDSILRSFNLALLGTT